jgi:hypothetical protein
MKKTIILALLTLIFACSLKAQSTLNNTNWKTYIGDPVNDTLVLHIRMDSSFVTGRGGEAVVRSLCKVSGDTVTFNDYDGQFACQNAIGKYKYSITDEVLSFVLIDDPCDGRAQSIVSTKWKKTK